MHLPEGQQKLFCFVFSSLLVGNPNALPMIESPTTFCVEEEEQLQGYFMWKIHQGIEMKNQQANIARVNHLLFMLFNILTGNKEEFQQFRVMLNCLVLTRSQGFLKNFALLQLIPVFAVFELYQKYSFITKINIFNCAWNWWRNAKIMLLSWRNLDRVLITNNS